MPQLNNEQYERLLKYEKHLNRAYNGNYVYNMLKSEAEEIFQIYNEVFLKNEKSTGCTRCRLNVCKLLGNQYFKYKTKNNIQKPKQNNEKGKTSKSRPKV